MAPPRESANTSDKFTRTTLWEGIEEDVEKKRHVKDPFREAFVALVATPFDAVCGETLSMRRQQQRIEEAISDIDDSERRHEDNGRIEREDCSVLQQEISARSQQVHLRLEILRRQVQCLVEESGSALDKAGRVVLKSEPHTKKKNPTFQSQAAVDTAEGHSVTDLETLLERVALYESGELTDSDLQKSWQRSKCKCTTHEIPGAGDKMESLRGALEIEYEDHRERRLLYFGPKMPKKNDEDHECRTDQTQGNDEMAQFLEGCRRSIKPFFLEDFVQLDQEQSQSDDASQDMECTSPPRIEEEEASPKLATEAEDVTMSEIDSSGEESERQQPRNIEPPTASDEPVPHRNDGGDREANQVALVSIEQLRSRREALRNQVREATDRRLSRSRKLQARVSRASGVSRASIKSTSAAKPPSLLADAKWWKIFSRSIIDPTVDLLTLRDVVVSRNGDFFQTDEPSSLVDATLKGLVKQETASETRTADLSHGHGEARVGSSGPIGKASDQPQTKRQSAVELAVRNKKQRVDNEPKSSRPLTLGKMVQMISHNFTRIAQTSCVSYLSAIIRSGISSGKPQRAFVALVFSASLANTTPDPRKSSPDKLPLRVQLHSARDERDVKIICQQRLLK